MIINVLSVIHKMDGYLAQQIKLVNVKIYLMLIEDTHVKVAKIS